MQSLLRAAVKVLVEVGIPIKFINCWVSNFPSRHWWETTLVNWKTYTQHPESGGFFYLVGMFRTPSLEDSISVPRKLQGGRKGNQVSQVCNKGSRQSEHQRSGIKLRNLAFCIWEDASLWDHWIHPFHMHLMIWGHPVFLLTLLLAFIPPASQQSPWWWWLVGVSQFGKLTFTFGGLSSLKAVTFLVE